MTMTDRKQTRRTMLQQRRVGTRYRCDGCGALFSDLQMHELIPRYFTTHHEGARLLSFEPELCAMLCQHCHDQAHTSSEERDRLFRKNYRRYEDPGYPGSGYRKVSAKYEQIVRLITLHIELPEEENA